MLKQRSVVAVGGLCAVISAIPAGARAQDGDGDGVPDRRDICLATRAGRTVDTAGCDAFCEVVYDDASGSAFIRSRLLEVGVADWGSFGADSAPPAGWHPSNPDNPNQFGFVANPADDDWATPQGDFFVPGSPEEGFGLNVGGVDYFSSRLQGERGVVGDFTGSRASCEPMVCGLRGGASTSWSGAVDGIEVDQRYTVFNEGVFILIEVTLRNTTASEQTVYYLRNVDPDNMVSFTGDYTTNNTIVSQGDGTSTSLALVSATTSGPDSYIAFASRDPDARVMFGGFANRDADGIWNCSTADIGDLECAPGASRFDDIGIAISIRKVIPAGESRSFSFVYALGAGSLDDSIACTVPAVCGDGTVEGTEACDDGNSLGSDGCDATCLVEDGWECNGAPSDCVGICGDGLEVGDEICDEMGDGPTCDADCSLAECGDGSLNSAAGEGCDDGNVISGDGCSSGCAVELDGGMPDAGSEDAGVGGTDAGVGGTDAGGGGTDAGGGGTDAGVGGTDAGVGGSPTSPATCGCRVGGREAGGGLGAFVFGALGFALAARRRR